MSTQIIEKERSIKPIEGDWCAGDRPSQRLIRPENLVQDLLDLMMRLIQIHADFLFDDVSFLFDLSGRKLRPEEHVSENIEEVVEAVVRGASMKTGCLFAGERVEITADAFNGLRNLSGGALAGSLKDHVFDEMACAV